MSKNESDEGEELKEGEELFNFEIVSAKGSKSQIRDLIGRRDIVVYFYPKDFTPGCTVEAEEFTINYDKFKEKGIEIIGISPDSYESHLKFRENKNIPYYLVSDEDNIISKKFGVYGLKKFMGKEYQGVNRSTFLIDKTGKIIKIFKKVKPKGHSNEVLKFFKERENQKE